MKEVGCGNRGDTSGGNGAINTVVEAATLHHFPPLCCTDKCADFCTMCSVCKVCSVQCSMYPCVQSGVYHSAQCVV